MRQVEELNNSPRRIFLEQKKQKNEMLIENQKNYQRIFYNWLFFDNCTTTLAVVGLILAMINFEIDVDCMDNDPKCNDLGNEDVRAMDSYRFN